MADTQPDENKRDFLTLTAAVTLGLGATGGVLALASSLTPSADVLALATTEVDVGQLEPGQAITVMWQGKPVFVRRRTAAEVEEAKNTPLDALKDPQSDADRTVAGKEEFLVVVGVCTHLGCIPNGQKDADVKGEYDGWYCPCHGSHYDISGRIRKGPAPTNLPVPKYEFTSDTSILIG